MSKVLAGDDIGGKELVTCIGDPASLEDDEVGLVAWDPSSFSRNHALRPRRCATGTGVGRRRPPYAPSNVSVENNIEVVRRLGEALSSRDWAAFEEFVAEDCEWTDVPSGRTIRGVKDLVDACRTFTTAFPGFLRREHDADWPRRRGRERVERSRNA
jgi:hypothetical protein